MNHSINLKTIILMLLLTVFSINVSAQEKRMTFSVKEASIQQVIKQIEAQTEYLFIYTDDIDLKRVVTVNLTNATLKEILSEVFKDTNVTFRFDKGHIVLKKETKAIPATVKIKGMVYDENSELLIGVTVINLSNNNSAVSVDGSFDINATEGDILQLSFLGYENYNYTVGASDKSIVVKMKPESVILDDVVVVGYGSQKKVNMTGAVSAVTFDEQMSSRNITSLSSGLTGLATGLSVIQNSGMAGSDDASMMIRGIGTVNNANPLIVVDDMPDVDINQINMSDVESITVLKDAAAAAVYGSRGANGVILVTTKSGNKLNASLKFNYSRSIDTPINPYSFMNDYARAMTLYQQRGEMSKYSEIVSFKNGTIDEWLAMQNLDPVRYPSTDWWDLIMRNGSTSNYSVSMTGGNEKSKIYTSISYLDKDGLQIYNDYSRYNVRINYTYDVHKNIQINMKADGSWGTQHYYSDTGFGSEILQYAIAGITPYYDGHYGGTMAYGEDVSTINPLALYENSISTKEKKLLNISSYLSWKPISCLTIRADYALKYYTNFFHKAATPVQAYNFQKEAPIDYWYIPANEGVYNNTEEGYKTLFNARINYDGHYGRNHHLSATAIYSEEYWFDRFQNSYRRDNLHPSLSELNSTLPDYQTTYGASTSEGLRSFVGRINYSAFDRYLFEFNIRADGSSKFAEGHRWGFFPSGSIGWKFSNERFIKRFAGRFLSNGKLRASYGTLGNNSGINYYEQLSTLANLNYINGNEIVKGFVKRKMTNKDLSWETTKVFNVGLDLSFFKNALSFEFDYYDKLTEGMIRPSDLSYMLNAAYDAPRTNIGNLRNRGFETNISYKGNMGPVIFKVNANLSLNRSRLESWNEYLGRGARFVGMPWGYTYGYVDAGIVQTWQQIMEATPQSARPGDILRVDVNGDGQITDDDMVAYPKYSQLRPPLDFGFGGQLSWQGIDFSFLFTGSWGRRDYWLNAYNNTAFGEGGYAVSWLHYYDLWNVNNTSASMNRMGGNNRYDSLYYLDDMSFLRLKNAQISYTLPTTWTKRIRISNIRLFFTGENLFTVTKYRGMDPERIGSKSDVYPQTRSYTFGISINI